ncbi:MAG: hypothetical protein K6A73_00765 [Bacteroidales bacterium]|nr:hypothetical protein [Bacteroidales bacterium]
MKLSVKGFITHKDGEAYDDCADRMAFDVRPAALRAAIADGVSCGSFLQAQWAQYLTEGFVSQADEITSVPLDVCRQRWQETATAFANSPDAHWMTKHMFQRHIPGAATLVSLVVSAKHKLWFAESLGDSCMFFVPQGTEYDHSKWIVFAPDSFDNYPNYYASYEGMDKGLPVYEMGNLEQGRFYIMTDALSEWLCRQKEDAIAIINNWENQDMFEASITQLRNEGILHNDDSTILIISIEDDGEELFTCNNEDKIFTDINKLI